MATAIMQVVLRISTMANSAGGLVGDSPLDEGGREFGLVGLKLRQPSPGQDPMITHRHPNSMDDSCLIHPDADTTDEYVIVRISPEPPRMVPLTSCIPETRTAVELMKMDPNRM